MRALRRQVLAHDVDRWATVVPRRAAPTRRATTPLHRSDVLDQPLAVDLLVVDAQAASVVDRLLGLVGHRAVHEHHHRRRVPLRGQHSHTDDVGLADQLTLPRLRDDVLVRAVLELRR